MKENTTSNEGFFSKIGGYSRTKLELFELYVIERLAHVVSFLAARLSILLIVVLFLLTMSVGVALWLSQLLGKDYYGFFIVAGLYLPVLFIFYIYRDRLIETPVNNSIISKLTNEEPHEK